MIALAQIIGTLERKMAMAKQPTPARKGIHIGSYDAIKDAAGKMTIKPKVSRKTSVSQKIAQRSSKRVRVVKGGQRP